VTVDIERLAQTLRDAREAKGLSQRGLSEATDVPQSHISKIENGAVDLRLSSLVTLARALGLEFTLVPRHALPAVNSIIRTARKPEGQSAPARPAYRLEEDDDG